MLHDMLWKESHKPPSPNQWTKHNVVISPPERYGPLQVWFVIQAPGAGMKKGFVFGLRISTCSGLGHLQNHAYRTESQEKAPCGAATVAWMYECITVSHFGQKCLLNALKCKSLNATVKMYKTIWHFTVFCFFFNKWFINHCIFVCFGLLMMK